MGRVGGVRPGAVVRALFANGEQGAWYDPSDFSTMFQDSAGTTPVTATGQPVGRLLDKSGRGNHQTQATAAARPVLQQDAQGFYYLDFDGVDDGMNCVVNFSATDKISWWLGIYRKNDTGQQQPFGLGGDVTGAFYLGVGSGANLSRFTMDGTTSRIDSVAYGINTKYVYSCRMDRAAPLASQVLPDVNLTSLSPSIGTAVSGNFISANFYIGSSIGVRRANVRLYQVICRGAATGAPQFGDVKTFVNTKTGAY